VVEDHVNDQDLYPDYDSIENTVLSNKKLSNDEILVFLRQNELTESEMTWLREFEDKSELEILRFVDLIMLRRDNV
jgi:hypothetical protein